MMNEGRAIIRGFYNRDIEEAEVVKVNPEESTEDSENSEDRDIFKAIIIIVIFGLIDTALLIGLYLK